MRLQRRQQHLVQVLVGGGEGDVGAAVDLQFDRLLFCVRVLVVVIVVNTPAPGGEQQEREDGLEDEKRARGPAGRRDADAALLLLPPVLL